MDIARELQRGVALELTAFLDYCATNLEAFRKILKKCNKQVGLLSPSQSSEATTVLQIYHPQSEEVLVQSSFLKKEFRQQLEAMQAHVEIDQMVSEVQRCMEALMRAKQAVRRGSGEVARTSMAGVPRRQSSLPIHDEEMLRRMAGLRRQLDFMSQMILPYDRIMAAQAGIFTLPPPDTQAVATGLGLFLNLMDAFLYMVNYNVVIPLNEKICDDLNINATAAGLIIGCSDVTAIFSSLLYSKWSNTSFKMPLIFSMGISVVGNLLFIWAYERHSLALLLVSRLFTGLGSARALNRRYIADFVGKAQRSNASLAFVGSSVLGMALGLLMAFPLSYVPPSTLRVLGAQLRVDEVTSAGWIMAATWLLFMLLGGLAFEEPTKKLEEGRAEAGGEEGEGVMKPLLEQAEGESPPATNTEEASPSTPPKPPTRPSIWQLLNSATHLCFYLLFLLKLVQQGSVSGAPLFMAQLTPWSQSAQSIFLAASALVMAVPSFGGGQLTRYVADRQMVLGNVVLLVVGTGLVITLPVGLDLHPWQYFTGFFLIYTATILLEGVAMSLMSKVMSPLLTKGFWNAGLLSTEAGSFGRLLGNAALMVLGSLLADGAGVVDITEFGNWLYGAFFAASLGGLVFTLLLYMSLNE